MKYERSELISLFLLAIATQTSLYSYPINFTRLIQEKDGKILKVVDLIGDYHVPQNEPQKLSAKQKKLLEEPILREFQNLLRSGSETKSLINTFLKNERGFLFTLQKMNNKLIKKQARESEDIALLWESGKTLKPHQGLPFLGYGYELSKALVGSHIRFIPSDGYRMLMDRIFSTLLYGSDNDFNEYLQSSEGQLGRNMLLKNMFPWDTMLSTDSPIAREIESLQSKLDERMFKHVQSLWENYKKQFTDFYNSFFLPSIQQNETIHDFVSRLEKLRKLNQFKARAADLFVHLTDLEFLINIFLSKQYHVIAYAGFAHTNNLAQLLTEFFDFEKVVAIGLAYFNIDPSFGAVFSLMPDAWQFLEEDPFVSLHRPEKIKYEMYYDTIKMLKRAIENGYEQAFETILKDGFKAHLNIVDIKFAGWQSPLHIAINHNRFSIAQRLLKYGADINGKTSRGVTPLVLALENNAPDAKITWLLDHKSDPTIMSSEEQIPPIMIALERKRSLALIKALLKSGANINQQDGLGYTALHEAVSDGNIELIKLLLSYEARQIENKEGKTPLDIATELDRQEIIDLLEQAKN